MRKLPLLVVEWADITTHRGWHREDEDVGNKVCHCVSVGWKVKSSREYLQLSPMRDDRGYCDDRIIIPRGCIRNIRRLAE